MRDFIENIVGVVMLLGLGYVILMWRTIGEVLVGF